MCCEFTIGSRYNRNEVAKLIDMPAKRSKGGSWTTGYDEWNGVFYIFANVGIPGRTGHNYQNRWLGKTLEWFGKTNSRRGQPQIDKLLSSDTKVRIFWRGKERSRFTFAGEAHALSASNEMPVRVHWVFENITDLDTLNNPDDSITWRRGPPPIIGTTQADRVDGPSFVYVLRLEGDLSNMLSVPEGHFALKVGVSNNVARRIRELNSGFPPGSNIKWALTRTKLFPSSLEAWEKEGICLEKLREQGFWIGGEFAVAPSQCVDALL